MNGEPISSKIADIVSFQDYADDPRIADVQRIPLACHRQLEGSFMEYLRLTAGNIDLPELSVPFEVRQISVSVAEPDRINAFHIHPKKMQHELWTIVTGRILVWLIDVRARSTTKDVKNSFVLSSEEPEILFIPNGVAHGFKAGPKGAVLMYASNQQFNAANANEGRIPWDHWGEDLWRVDKG